MSGVENGEENRSRVESGVEERRGGEESGVEKGGENKRRRR